MKRSILSIVLTICGSLFFVNSAFAVKTGGDVIEVFNQPSIDGTGTVFMPIATYTLGTINATVPAMQTVAVNDATFISFTINEASQKTVTSDITISVRDVFTGTLYTCDQKIPHDSKGPAGNWRALISLSSDGYLTCQMGKLS